MWLVKNSMAWRDGFFEGGDAGVAVLMEDPGLRGTPAAVPKCRDGELGDADVVQPGGDGHALLPVGEAAAVAEVDLLLEHAVRDHLVMRGRGDQELAGGFVVGMVDGGQPLVRKVRPVGAEETALAVLVVEDLEAGGGFPAILDGEGAQLAGGGRGRERDDQAIAVAAESPCSLRRRSSPKRGRE